MFVDLEGPLNASSLLSASAELLVVVGRRMAVARSNESRMASVLSRVAVVVTGALGRRYWSRH